MYTWSLFLRSQDIFGKLQLIWLIGRETYRQSCYVEPELQFWSVCYIRILSENRVIWYKSKILDTVLSWSPKRYAHTLRLKQEAMNKARKMWVDYVFFIDADNIITNADLLSTLIRRNKLIVGPMLETGVAFSNYWSAQVITNSKNNPVSRMSSIRTYTDE